MMKETVKQLGEFELIDALSKILKKDKRVVEGIGDDTAVLAYDARKYQLFTTDMLVEDVHFTRRMRPEAVGHKALACNISDIASMGGFPSFAVVSVGLPKTASVSYVKDLYKGMELLARRFKVRIVGGDTVKSDKIIINVALLGEVLKKNLVTRSGGRPGDWVFVTGYLGGSFTSGKHLTFMPRLMQAQFLVRHFKPSSMMDISDGLAGDLDHILKASGVGVELWMDKIPCNKGASLRQALSDGEDFELLFTISAVKAKRLLDWQARHKQWYFYPVGRIVKDRRKKIDIKGFTHF